MFPNEAGRQLINWLTLVPVAQTQIIVPLSGIGLLVILMALGGYWGYQRGVRSLLTVVVLTSLAYLWCVQGGDVVFGAVNRLISIIPRFAGIVFNREDWAAPPWLPQINPTELEPLGWRIVVFISAVVISFIFNRVPWWYAKAPAGIEPLSQSLGLYGGALIALLWTTAAGVFYRTAEADGTLFVGILGDILRAIPDVGPIGTLVPMGLFFLILLTIVTLRLPILFRVPVPAPAQKK